MQNVDNLNNVIAEIAAKHQRMDGLIAAAGVQMVVPALEYPPDKISEVSCVFYVCWRVVVLAPKLSTSNWWNANGLEYKLTLCRC